MRIGLVGCVKSKRSPPSPAKELYTSPVFTGARRAVESGCNLWFILSAEHGLLDPDTVTEPYDRTLATVSRRRRREWRAAVLSALGDKLGDSVCTRSRSTPGRRSTATDSGEESKMRVPKSSSPRRACRWDGSSPTTPVGRTWQSRHVSGAVAAGESLAPSVARTLRRAASIGRCSTTSRRVPTRGGTRGCRTSSTSAAARFRGVPGSTPLGGRTTAAEVTATLGDGSPRVGRRRG